MPQQFWNRNVILIAAKVFLFCWIQVTQLWRDELACMTDGHPIV